MPTTIPDPSRRLSLRRHPVRCMADVAARRRPHPAVVLVHGFGATHDMMLAQYEQHFAAAGIATLAFDYRNTGSPTANRGNIFRCARSAPTWRRRWTMRERTRRSTRDGSACGGPALAG